MGRSTLFGYSEPPSQFVSLVSRGQKKKSISGFLCLENGAAGLGCMSCVGAELWVQIWKLLSEVPGSSSLNEHYLALCMSGARSIAAVGGEGLEVSSEKRDLSLHC